MPYCPGCNKFLLTKDYCDPCGRKPWHQIDKSLEKYAIIYFKQRERAVELSSNQNYWPIYLYDREFWSFLDEYWKPRFNSINDVTYDQVMIQKRVMDFRREEKLETKRMFNDEKDSYPDYEYYSFLDKKRLPPKSNSSTRICSICKVKKPLTLEYFYFKKQLSKKYFKDNPEELNEFNRHKILGKVCRECWKKDQNVKAHLSKLGVKKREHKYLDYMGFMKVGRTLVEFKQFKREMKKNEQSNNRDVQAK